MIPDRDGWQAALLIVKRYGDDAMVEASERADQLLDGGDLGRRRKSGPGRMTMSKSKAERVLDLICAAASEAVAMTEEDRETYLRWQKQSFYDEAKKAGNPELRAVEISEKMDEWTRDLIKTILIGGGAGGGRA